ncbi:MAG: DeoR/GlpR transcriptional regulator [Anaerolineae bacterium]|nr:DeoR/GlpR transcriptional regulator [Anaerolineae bacterium]
MYSAQRRQEILKLIQQTGLVSVDDLAARFAVSPSTVRRDLNELHRLGVVQRTYGGALTPDSPSSEAPFNVRVTSRHEEKDRIGKAAAELVRPGETIFIDGGTTTEYMLTHLPAALAERDNGLASTGSTGLASTGSATGSASTGSAGGSRTTVVTYGLNIVQRLIDQEHITIVLIGGILHTPTLTFGGVFAADSFEGYNMRFDKAFMAASGVSAEAGITNAGFEEIPIKRRAMRSARESIMLADSTKIGVIAAGVVAPTEQLTRLITTTEAPPQEIDALRRHGVLVDLV